MNMGNIVPEEMDEHLLATIARAKAGDKQAQESIVEKFTPLIHKLVQKHSNFGSDYEDLVQDVKIKVLEAILLFNPSKSQFMTFAHTLITYTLYRHSKLMGRKKRGGNLVTITLDNSAMVALEANSMSDYTASDSTFSYIHLVDVCENSLNRVEIDVLSAASEGNTYHDISTNVGRTYQRITDIKQNLQKKVQSSLAGS
jgi:RNA polymerase sporulation-specific sigma factor